ncbi:arrestin domain-containing protein 3-like [Chironomus tepperi]|uniref:arrestin domain-containing protein 3-like n=1 Tax=Chironomus tepperi TaxID=113505 RepID=UPI00391F1ACC
MAEIRINLEPNVNGVLVFSPGDTLRGNAELIVQTPKRMREFYIHIVGEAIANWSSSGCHSTTIYTGKEPLIDFKMTVLGEENGPKFMSDPGAYKCEYAFKLPDNIPYSLEESGWIFDSYSGTIAYRVEAVVDNPYKMSKKIEFIVTRHDDLNLYPELKLPLKIVKQKIFPLFFKNDEILDMIVSIPYTGFSINQRIPVTVEYKNESTVDIRQTVVKFIRILTLVFPKEENPKIKTKESVVCEGRTHGCLAKNSIIIPIELVVPNLSTSNDMFCKVVSITYVIQIVAEIDSAFQTNKKVRIPVTIGKVPIRFEDQVQNNNTQ